ncbi:MAG: hypothetical protein FWC57_03680, partial [Endomicrobia bacterium]|nr:hypothetical protein [Endomicrobiia bacterium]
MPLFIGAAVNAFAAQVYVNSASELNNAIINAVNGGTITITKDFAADANISAINNLKVSIGKDGTTDYFLSGNNSYGGFAIANSTVSINGINLSGFRKSDYGGALYAVSSTIKYTGNNIILSNNICSNAPIGSNVFGYVYGGAVYSESSANTFVSSGVIKFSNNSAAGSGSGHASGSGSGGAVYSVSSTNTFVSS